MFDARVHHRRSIRLRGYDYSHPGAYAVTVCTHLKRPVFGEIVEGEMVLNDAGQMVQETWEQMPSHYPDCGLDAFVVMPNHVHGIILITATTGQARGPAPTSMSLQDLVHRFKSLTTARYRQGIVDRQVARLGRQTMAAQLLRAHHSQ
jgi:REP element-mobilizing transposase RayT